jgi:hypothetical protein
LIHTILRAVCSKDDQTDDRAFGADDVAGFGLMSRKLRFLLIADSATDLEVLRIGAESGGVPVSADVRTMSVHFRAFTTGRESPSVLLIPPSPRREERRKAGTWLRRNSHHSHAPLRLAGDGQIFPLFRVEVRARVSASDAIAIASSIVSPSVIASGTSGNAR